MIISNYWMEILFAFGFQEFVLLSVLPFNGYSKYLTEYHKFESVLAIIKRFCAKDDAFCTDDNL